MFALVDGNNFYVSCERSFRPSLMHLPVIVLSNNDGCAIARSNEAKALGIKMGHPWFKVQREFPDAGIVALSANFTLYGDMSNRMMAIAAGLGPRQEIYSIDECFVDMEGVRGDLAERARKVRERILQWIGIPCGIGIGPTKTLAKLANHVAKTADRKPGSYPAEFARVFDIARIPSSDLDAVLSATPVGEVWGIGPRIARQLTESGISNVLQFVQLDAGTVRRRWNVVLERTLRELQGQACLSLEDAPAPRQQIACTRSFGQTVTSLDGIVEAVSEFAGRAAEKLRRQGGQAGQVLVFMHTSPFRQREPQYSNSMTVPLRRPTADTPSITQAAVRAAQVIWRPGYRFAKAGVMLLDLQAAGIEQGELSLEDDAAGEQPRLMAALDRLNDRYGKNTVRMGSTGTGGDRRGWVMKQEMRTPMYTTRWQDIPLVRA